MPDFSSFRTALNGFNRSDVVSYIESLSAGYQKSTLALQEENKKLMGEKLRLEARILQMQSEEKSLQEQVVSLAQEASDLAEKLAQAEADRDAAEKAFAEMTPAAEMFEQSPEEDLQEPAEKIAAEPEAVYAAAENGACQQTGTAETEAYQRAEAAELAAYRRAEAAERNAIQRANRIYSQLSGLCENARGKYLESGDEIAALTADLSSGLSRLQEAFADIQLIFDEAENAFDELELPDCDE